MCSSSWLKTLRSVHFSHFKFTLHSNRNLNLPVHHILQVACSWVLCRGWYTGDKLLYCYFPDPFPSLWNGVWPRETTPCCDHVQGLNISTVPQVSFKKPWRMLCRVTITAQTCKIEGYTGVHTVQKILHCTTPTDLLPFYVLLTIILVRRLFPCVPWASPVASERLRGWRLWVQCLFQHHGEMSLCMAWTLCGRKHMPTSRYGTLLLMT